MSWAPHMCGTQVLDKVVEGRLSKLLADWCLEAQRYVLEDDLTVDKMMARWVAG